MKLPLIGSSGTMYSLAASASASINCYVESMPADEGKNKLLLRGAPGMHLFKDLTAIDAAATPVRGLWSGGGRLFVAAGTKEFEVSAAGALVGSAWTIADDATHTPVTMLANGSQLGILSAQTFYVDYGYGPQTIALPASIGVCDTFVSGSVYGVRWKPGATPAVKFDVGLVGNTITIVVTGYTVKEVVNPELLYLTTSAGVQTDVAWSATPTLKGSSLAFLDGYFILSRPSSRQINIPGLMDASAWRGLDLALKEGYPDYLAAVWSEPPLLYMLGTETLEVWRNTGNASFPLERVDGGYARVGLAAPYSCASIMGKLHMVAGGTYGAASVVRMEGIQPIRISTHAVEEALAGMGTLATKCVGYSYLERGHWFYELNTSGSIYSWVYDFTESARLGEPQWHQRARWNNGTQLFEASPASYHTFIPEWGSNGMHIVGDRLTGKLYEMSADYFDDAGNDIRCVRTTPFIYHEGKRVYHQRVEFEMETGTVTPVPVVTMYSSDDRGRTFTNGRTLGPAVNGQYSTRFYAAGLGSSRGRVYQLNIQGKGKVAVIDGVLEASLGLS